MKRSKICKLARLHWLGIPHHIVEGGEDANKWNISYEIKYTKSIERLFKNYFSIRATKIPIKDAN